MAELHPSVKETIRTIGLGGIIALTAVLIQYSSMFITKMVSLPSHFIQIAPTEWNIAPIKLDPGLYYVSVGRPRTACDLLIGDQIIASDRASNGGLRTGLLLGGSFHIKNTNERVFIRIVCPYLSGFSARLSQEPIIATFRLGILVHFYRGFLDLLIGPFSSILIIGLILFLTRRTAQNLLSRSYTFELSSRPYVFFSLSCLAYTLSLAYYPMLFIEGTGVILLHSIIRHTFAIAVLYLFGSYSRLRWDLISLHIITIGIVIIANSIIPIGLESIYQVSYVLIPLSTGISLYELLRVEEKVEAISIFRLIAAGWLFVQLVDMSLLQSQSGMYIAPSYLALFAIFVTFAKYRERVRSEKLELAASRILSIIEGNSSLPETLSMIARVVAQETKYTRVSAYIDAYCLGQSDIPSQSFIRVIESGYTKETKVDQIISFIDGRGKHIAHAISRSEIVFQRGSKDRAWFTVLPIGKFACINLSNEKETPAYSAYESQEVLCRLLPALSSLNNRLLSHALQTNRALEKLRLIKGDGQWEVEIGAVFADIVGYSTYTEIYGPAFGKFVNDTFFPTLIKIVATLSVPELIRGDEVLLISISELIAPNLTVPDATVKTVVLILDFLEHEGAQICKANGFVPLKMTIGVNIGKGVIVCNSLKVSTSGQVVNEAKRLQEAASEFQPLISDSASKLIKDENIIFGSEIPILIKKNFILARPLILKKT